MRSALCSGSCTLRAIFALIHWSAWKRNSAKFACSAFCDVRQEYSEEVFSSGEARGLGRWHTGIMNVQILPLAITMMAGPQIMSAIIFVTAPKALRVSLPFLAGVAIATTVGVIIT